MSHLFEGMMRTLYKVEGAQFRIEILETPKIQKFINAHSAALDSSFQKVEMSEQCAGDLNAQTTSSPV